MIEYIGIIISFIAGGSLSTLMTVRYLRKNSKIDYTEKAINFVDHQYDKVLQKNQELEERIIRLEALIPIACFNFQCENRQSDDREIHKLLKTKTK